LSFLITACWHKSRKLLPIVDTFNFSFFEDKPETAPAPADQAASSAHPTPAAVPPPEASNDPFGFDGFDFASDPLAPDALAPTPPAPAPVSAAPAIAEVPSVPPLELDPNAHFASGELPAFDQTQSGELTGDFPDLALALPLSASPNPDPPSFDTSALDATQSLADDFLLPAQDDSPSLLGSVPAPQAADSDDAPRAPAGLRRRFLTADDPHAELAPKRDRLRIAVLGASGIGLNHARWMDKHAGEVVAFLGSSNDSVAETATRLEAELGHPVPGFSDIDALLKQTNPQAVCIATPPALHFGQALSCLEAGAHVLCEKPLVYFAGRSKRENRDGARELLKTATKRNLVLATQLQYGAATPILCRLAGVTPFEVGDFAMELETVNPRLGLDAKNVWIELGPHPLSIAQFLAGENAQLAEDTLQVSVTRGEFTSEVMVRFGVRCDGGRLLMCRVIVRAFDVSQMPHEPSRRVAFNGRVVSYNGVKLADGSYIAQYISSDGYISHYPDPVDFLVGNFIRTCWGDDQLVISPAQGVQNLEWLLGIADKVG